MDIFSLLKVKAFIEDEILGLDPPPLPHAGGYISMKTFENWAIDLYFKNVLSSAEKLLSDED